MLTLVILDNEVKTVMPLAVKKIVINYKMAAIDIQITPFIGASSLLVKDSVLISLPLICLSIPW